MTWASNGSVGDRLRALQIRDDIILKQEQDPMGMMDAGVQNVPGPNGQPGGLPDHLTGAGNPSALGVKWDDMESWLKDGGDQIGQIERLMATFAGQNIDEKYPNEVDDDMLSLRQLLGSFTKIIRGLRVKHAQLSQNDPSENANDVTNSQLNTATAGAY